MRIIDEELLNEVSSEAKASPRLRMRQSGSMDAISPLYVSRMLNVPLEEVEKCMKEMGI